MEGTTELTVLQAINLGYTHFGYPGDQWQRMNEIAYYRANDPKDAETALLFEIEPSRTASIHEDTILDLVAEDIATDWEDQMGDDDSQDIVRIIKALGSDIFKEAAEKINESLSDKHCYSLTKIRLIP